MFVFICMPVFMQLLMTVVFSQDPRNFWPVRRHVEPPKQQYLAAANDWGGEDWNWSGDDGSGGDLLSYDEFAQAVQANYPNVAVSDQDFKGFLTALQDANIQDRTEAAMFLAQVLWESGGLQFREEIACQRSKCPNQYRVRGDRRGRYYYGRGYIQLTWSYNYRQASLDLFGDLRLLNNPDMVAQDIDLSWRTAAWFWGKIVQPQLSNNPMAFGITTQYINGALECVRKGKRGPFVSKAKKRYANFLRICDVLGITGVVPDGCYNGQLPQEYN